MCPCWINVVIIVFKQFKLNCIILKIIYNIGYSVIYDILLNNNIIYNTNMNMNINKIIYPFTFSRRFYPKRLTVHSGYTFFLSVHVFPGNRTHKLCAANAMLYHWVTVTLYIYINSNVYVCVCVWYYISLVYIYIYIYIYIVNNNHSHIIMAVYSM